MDQFLEKHQLPKLIQLEVDTLNGPISMNEIEFVIGFFPQGNPGPECLTSDHYQTHRGEIIPLTQTLSFRKSA